MNINDDNADDLKGPANRRPSVPEWFERRAFVPHKSVPFDFGSRCDQQIETAHGHAFTAQGGTQPAKFFRDALVEPRDL